MIFVVPSPRSGRPCKIALLGLSLRRSHVFFNRLFLLSLLPRCKQLLLLSRALLLYYCGTRCIALMPDAGESDARGDEG